MPREVIYSDNAINWVWYGTLVIDDEAHTAYVKPDSSYRLHKYNDSQGADKHPYTNFSFATYNGGNVTGSDHFGCSLRNRVTQTTEQFILCDLIDGVVTPRPLEDWVIESKRKRG